MPDPAEVMIQVMVEATVKPMRAGAPAEAIAAASKYIPSLETQDAKVLQTFGSALAVLYLLRGTSRRALGLDRQDDGQIREAEGDLAKGLALMAQYGDPSETTALAAVVDRIRAMNAPGQAVIEAFLAEASLTSARSRRPAQAAVQAGHGLRVLGRWALGTLVGGVLWIVAVLLFTRVGIGMSRGNIFVMLLTVAPLYALIMAGIKGWSWFSQYAYNTFGGMLKTFAFLLLGVSVIGTLPVFYWTGKGVLETCSLWEAED
jgi:hypothetical protein